MSSSPETSSPADGSLSLSEALVRFGRWCRSEPLAALLLAGCVGTLIYFFGFLRIFGNGTLTTMRWAYEAWGGDNDLEHGPLILPAAMVVAWMHRDELRRLPRRVGTLGLLCVLFGVLLFLASVWTLQPRIALVALPTLIFGGVWFVWGWPTARKIAFPCALLLFMIPLGFLLGHTEPLQRLVAVVVQGGCALLGLGIERDGVTLMASDGSFQCQVAGGCSGIRSLMAMTLLSAVYVHFTQRVLWKKVLIFAASLPFAVIGNIARVFTIVLFARFIDPTIGTGVYHDISGFIITIPIALWLLLRFGDLLNRDWGVSAAPALAPAPAARASVKQQPAASSSPISYDY
jgi:exosortase